MAKKEQPDPLAKLSLKQRRYVEEIVNGKTKKDAALAAGYTESVACTPGRRIETEDVREAFRLMMQQVAPFEKCAQRISEGQDAEIREPIIYRGKIIGWSNVPDYKERREYTKLAVEWASYHIPEAKLDVSGTVKIDPGERLEALFSLGFARRDAISDSERAVGSSEHPRLGPHNAEGS